MVEWERVELGKQADIYRGGSPRPIQAYLTQRSDGVNWIKIGDVAPNAKYINYTEERIIPEGVANSRTVSKGDFILSNSMSFGRPYILNIDGCIHDGWLTIQNYQKNFDTDFLYYVLGSEDILQQYASMAAGSSVQNLNKEKVSMVVVCKPPLPEQRRIATVLSDTDALITALEKLIDKKRNIKQGTMQELLTGKLRLPGFSGEWVEKPLAELFDFSGGLSASWAQLSDKGYPYLHYGNIHSSDKTYVNMYADGLVSCLDVDINKVVNTSLLKNGDIVFVDASEDDEGASRHVVVRSGEYVPFISGLHTIIAKAKTDELDDLFREFCFQTADIKAQFKFYAVGTKVMGVNKVTIGKIILRFPESKSEQHRIAVILSDMDAEIDALTAKLTKFKHIKQGMMSELLTGRIRLLDQKTKTIPVVEVVELPKQKQKTVTKQTSGHSQQFDDAVMIAGIVDVLYSNKYPLGRKKVQKCLYLLRRHQGASTAEFKKKAAGPYADEIRYKGGEPIARNAHYVTTTTVKDKGTTFARGDKISQALGYINSWGKQDDIKWVADKLKFKRIDELELLATVDMAICDLEEAGTAVSVTSIKNLIETNEEWKAKLKKQTFSDANIAHAIHELQTLMQGGN